MRTPNKNETEVYQSLQVQPVSARRLAIGLDINEVTVYGILRRLQQKKLIVKVRPGLYAVPGSNAVLYLQEAQ